MPEHSQPKPKITIRLFRRRGAAAVVAVAYDEDGEVVASHVCSSEGYVRHDMGITSQRHHEDYAQRYPGGYELVYEPAQGDR